jgi:hypothetical protein
VLAVKRAMEISTTLSLANQVLWVFESDFMNATQWVSGKAEGWPWRLHNAFYL